MFVKIREVCYIRRETNFSYTVGQVCLEYERMIHQGNRSDLTGNHLGITAEQVGRKFNVSGRTVSRYIRLGLLDKGILDFIAVNKLSIRTGVELSYLSCNIQNALVVETMEKDMYSFLKHNRNCQLWVIDYAGLAKSRPIAKFDKRYDGYEIIVELYTRAKEIAKTADIGVFIVNQFNDKGVEASEQGKPILPGYTQGGFIASRQADYDLAMTMTQAQKLANLCMLSTVKERAAVGFKNQPLSRDLAVSIFRQIKKQEGM